MLAKKSLVLNILEGIMSGDGFVSVSSESSFMSGIFPALSKRMGQKSCSPRHKKKIYDTFYRLKNEDLIKFETRGKQIYISLTKEGKKKAGKNQIDDLEIKKPKKWDKTWRILIFDINEKQKIKREALRGKIKELGFYQLQKSVWVCPYEFKEITDIIRAFFQLTKDEIKVITASDIEDDQKIKNFFKVQ